jgi:hypothetical protein
LKIQSSESHQFFLFDAFYSLYTLFVILLSLFFFIISNTIYPSSHTHCGCISSWAFGKNKYPACALLSDYGTHCVSKIFYFYRESPRKSHDFVYQKMEKPYDSWVWDCSLGSNIFNKEIGKCTILNYTIIIVFKNAMHYMCISFIASRYHLKQYDQLMNIA